MIVFQKLNKVKRIIIVLYYFFSRLPSFKKQNVLNPTHQKLMSENVTITYNYFFLQESQMYESYRQCHHDIDKKK